MGFMYSYPFGISKPRRYNCKTKRYIKDFGTYTIYTVIAMKLTIEITPSNKERIKKVIDILLDEDAELSIDSGLNASDSTGRDRDKGREPAPIDKKASLLRKPANNVDVVSGSVIVERPDERPRLVGTWGQFNTFFSIKAALRVLANHLHDAEKESMNLGEFVDLCVKTFNETKVRGKPLRKFRGFPSSKKDSAKSRFVNHFLETALEMGFIGLVRDDNAQEYLPYSSHEWNKIHITLTTVGLDFGMLDNNLFDLGKDEQVLTDAERQWILSYLKEIDSRGYREYSILKEIHGFLSDENNGKDELVSWLEENETFETYVSNWSQKRKDGDEEGFRKQIRNLAITFVSSKVALLRELGVLSGERNRYEILSDLM